MTNPNYPQLTEVLTVTCIDANGKTQTHSWTLHSEHPTMTKDDVPYEEARQRLYETVGKEVPHAG